MNEHLYQSTSIHKLDLNNIHTCYKEDTCATVSIFYFKTEMLYNYVSQNIRDHIIRRIQV